MRRSLPGAPRRAVPTLALLGGALLAQGCELAEVTTAPGVDLLVVESVLRAGRGRQDVVLHRTLSGAEVRGEPGARVAVFTPEGEEVVLAERALELCTSRLERSPAVPIEASCYSSAPGELDVRPGEAYELRIETRRGESARARTVVPSDFQLRNPRLSSSPGACFLLPRTPLEMVWSRSGGAWSYLATMRVSGLRGALAGTGIEAPEILELTGVTVSERDTTLVLPGEIGLFDRFGGDQELLLALQEGFPAGVDVEVVVGAADRNLVNAVRGGGFNPSGNVRVSSVVGDAVGVFGSFVPRRLSMTVGHHGRGLAPCAG